MEPVKTVLDTQRISQFGTYTEYSSSSYIAEKMIGLLKDNLWLEQYRKEIIKADSLYKLQKRLRKGSWAARCLTWDGMYRAKKWAKKSKPLRVKRLNPLKVE